MTTYDEGYQAAIDQFISMIDNTIANKEVMATLPTEWVLKILRVSLLTNDEEQRIIIYITPKEKEHNARITVGSSRG